MTTVYTQGEVYVYSVHTGRGACVQCTHRERCNFVLLINIEVTQYKRTLRRLKSINIPVYKIGKT